MLGEGSVRGLLESTEGWIDKKQRRNISEVTGLLVRWVANCSTNSERGHRVESRLGGRRMSLVLDVLNMRGLWGTQAVSQLEI